MNLNLITNIHNNYRNKAESSVYIKNDDEASEFSLLRRWNFNSWETSTEKFDLDDEQDLLQVIRYPVTDCFNGMKDGILRGKCVRAYEETQNTNALLVHTWLSPSPIQNFDYPIIDSTGIQILLKNNESTTIATGETTRLPQLGTSENEYGTGYELLTFPFIENEAPYILTLTNGDTTMTRTINHIPPETGWTFEERYTPDTAGEIA
jgi:hypothetical protein